MLYSRNPKHMFFFGIFFGGPWIPHRILLGFSGDQQQKPSESRVLWRPWIDFFHGLPNALLRLWVVARNAKDEGKTHLLPVSFG